MTYELIRKANETIQTTDIKGKQYAEVNQRIKAFRMVYPTGCIYTEMLSNENGVCVFKAMATYSDEDGEHMLGTGHAYENENSSFINKTSYIENCETSAIGRALGACGFGIDTSVCSAEELQNALLNQNNDGYKPSKNEMPDAVMCPKCGNPVTRYKYRGVMMQPEEIISKWGMCVPCYTQSQEVNNG